MPDALDKDCFEVTTADDEHPVKAFAPDGADHALAVSIRLRFTGQSCPGPVRYREGTTNYRSF